VDGARPTAAGAAGRAGIGCSSSNARPQTTSRRGAQCGISLAHQNFISSTFTIDLGPLEAVPIGEGRAYRIEERTIAVFRLGADELRAIDDRCPHDAGSLANGFVEASVVTCPRHGRRFELSSGHCLDDGTRVRCYPMRLVSGRMNLILEE